MGDRAVCRGADQRDRQDDLVDPTLAELGDRVDDIGDDPHIVGQPIGDHAADGHETLWREPEREGDCGDADEHDRVPPQGEEGDPLLVASRSGSSGRFGGGDGYGGGGTPTDCPAEEPRPSPRRQDVDLAQDRP
jgi:hypothetical protein